MTDDVVKKDATTSGPDYASMDMTELMTAMAATFAKVQAGTDTAANLKLFGILSKLHVKLQESAEKAKKDEALKRLVDTTNVVRGLFATLADVITGDKSTDDLLDAIEAMPEDFDIEGTDGIWFAFDYGAIREKGINPSCRLVKSTKAPKAEGAGGGSPSKSSYVANPAKSADLLKEVGDVVMFEEETIRTIAKEDITFPAGMTLNEAYEYSQNGGWRNTVRMAILKAAAAKGLVTL